MIDWSACPDVECVAGRISGAWVVRGTRIPAQAIVDNAEDGFPAERMAQEIYQGLPIDRARRVIAFATSASVIADL
jgi:uncharacterized protein (DUF433 family)